MTAPGSCQWPCRTPPSLSHCSLRSRGSRHCCPRMLAGAGPSGPRTSRALGAAPGRSGTGERGTQIGGEAKAPTGEVGGSGGLGMGCGLLSLSVWKQLRVLRTMSPAGFPSLASLLLHPQNCACSSGQNSSSQSVAPKPTASLGTELEMQILRLCWWGSATCAFTALGDPDALHTCVPLS